MLYILRWPHDEGVCMVLGNPRVWILCRVHIPFSHAYEYTFENWRAERSDVMGRDGGGGEAESKLSCLVERVMVVATTSPPLTFLVWTLILHFRFVHSKGDDTTQREEFRDADYSLLTLRQPCRIFQHCPLLYGLCFYHAMSNFFHYSLCIIDCRSSSMLQSISYLLLFTSPFCFLHLITPNQSQTIIKSSTHKCLLFLCILPVAYSIHYLVCVTIIIVSKLYIHFTYYMFTFQKT